LLLSLGEFDKDKKLPAEKRKSLADRLLRDYRDDPDPGIHSADDWLLRRWGHGEQLREIDQKLAGRLPAGKRRWYVTKQQGHTLAIVNDVPVKFQMGSPDEEPDRQADEVLHRRRISRSFALATKEVTVKQFQEFLKANPSIRHEWGASQKFNQNLDGPIIGVTWFEAAQYCRWLSEKEDIPEDQMCYPPIPEIKPGMQMPADYLSRKGFRLPREAEWEYHCRAGAGTSRHYGVAEEMLSNYAWYSSNSRNRPGPVGSKKPNDYGLFDMLGNAWEWCQDAYAPYPPNAGGPPVEDREEKQPITALQDRVLRGGAFLAGAGDARSAARSKFPPQVRLPLVGLRVAQTCR
jgi:formylglycine-generating enzyme required for sulfatase activity